jgi:hypothetical protein
MLFDGAASLKPAAAGRDLLPGLPRLRGFADATGVFVGSGKKLPFGMIVRRIDTGR